jgi:lysophospholipase L1-like esterase
MTATTAIVGDSYVRRLRDFAMERGDPHLHIARETIVYYALGGASIRGHKPILPLLTRAIRMTSVRTILISIGSNDVCVKDCDPEQIASDIISLVRYALARDDNTRVVVCQLSERRIVPYAMYNKKIRKTNRVLRRLLKGIPRARFVFFRGFTEAACEVFAADGIHYNAKGLRRFLREIRGAILRATIG